MNSTIKQIRTLAMEGDLDEARIRLSTLSESSTDLAEAHDELARCALELAMPSLALKELNLVIRDHPQNTFALQTLAEIHQDRGESDKELRYRRRLSELTEQAENETRIGQLTEPAQAMSKPQDSEKTPVETPPDSDIVRFLHMVSGRENVHARMWYDRSRGTGYSPVRQPLTVPLLKAHLQGSTTLGVYPVRIDQTVTFFAFDIDVTRAAVNRARGDRKETRYLRRELRLRATDLTRQLNERNLDFLLVDSGYKGRHVWFFLKTPLPATLVRRFALALAHAIWEPHRDLSIEVFPKQSEVSTDTLGNLIKLPLGKHLYSKRRAWILDKEGRQAEDPWAALRRIRKLMRDEILDRLDNLRTDIGENELEAQPEPEGSALPGPAPLPDAPSWTEAQFETNPEISALKRRCPVLDTLISKGLESRRLNHDEQIVLRHTLGHVPQGIPAANYVLTRCPEVPQSMMLQSQLRGNPISCAKIRKRISDVTSRVDCHCEFTVATDHYPTPTLHLEEARARGELDEDHEPYAKPEVLAEDLARHFVHLQEKHDRIGEELREVRKRFLAALERLPGRKLETAEGVWQVGEEEDFPVIDWIPDSSEELSEHTTREEE